MLQSKLLSQFKDLKHAFYQKGENKKYREVTFINQIHSSKVVMIESQRKNVSHINADGMITREKRFLGVRTADCLPILIFAPKSKIIGAVHAGWRGLLAGILKNLVLLLREHGNTLENIFIAIGPHIKACCYNVELSRIKAFEKEGIDKKLFTRCDGLNWYIDLGKIATFQLTNLGIPLSQIELMPYCTSCDKNFCSLRREGENCGRMVSLIGFEND